MGRPAVAEDYYKTLGVSRDAGLDAIRKAFRRLALRFHPDKNPGNPAAEKKFKEVSEAFEVLSDPAKRKAYDEHGTAGVKDMGFEGFRNNEEIFSRFGDIFGDLFGGRIRRERQAPRRGGDLRFAMMVPFREAALGATREIVVPVQETCARCGGTGQEGAAAEACATCGGSGQSTRQGQPLGGFFSFSTPCQACAGTGRRIGRPCPQCAGRGLVPKDSRISVRIPPGIKNGAVLRIAGQGGSGPGGGPRGDLLIEMALESDPVLERDGLDIRSSVKVPFPVALLGGKVDVETLRQKVSLTVPPGTSGDSWLRIRGQGIQTQLVSGDHLVRIVITVPKEVPPEVEKALREHMAAPSPSP